MTCQYEEKLSAYLDGELTREERKALTIHLHECPSCRNLLSELKNLQEWADNTLAETFSTLPPADLEAEDDIALAWAKFSQTVNEVNGLPAPAVTDLPAGSGPQVKRSWITMKKFRKLLTGIAAAVIFVSFLMVPQVQTLASDFLSLFRVSKIEMVKITQKDLQEVESFFHSGDQAEINFKELGRIWIEEGNFAQKVFQTAEEALRAGVVLPTVPSAYAIDSIRVQPSATVNMELDTAKANLLMKRLGSAAAFDPGLNGKKFSVVWPAITSINLQNSDKTFDNLVYSVSDTPRILAPSLVDAEKLRTTLLQAPFIPEGVRSQLAQINDWQSTLPFPYIEGAGDIDVTEKIVVNGGDGIFVKAKNKAAVLLWEDQGQLHSLQAVYQQDYNAETLKASLLALAQKL